MNADELAADWQELMGTELTGAARLPEQRVEEVGGLGGTQVATMQHPGGRSYSSRHGRGARRQWVPCLCCHAP